MGGLPPGLWWCGAEAQQRSLQPRLRGRSQGGLLPSLKVFLLSRAMAAALGLDPKLLLTPVALWTLVTASVPWLCGFHSFRAAGPPFDDVFGFSYLNPSHCWL